MRINTESLAGVEHNIAQVFPSATNIVQRIVDPLFAAVAYLVLAFWAEDTITKQDEVLAFIVALIFFPSTPIGRSWRKYVVAVLVSWVKVIACLFIFDLVGHFSAGFNMTVIELWAMLVPVSIIAMHTAGAPLKNRLNFFTPTQRAVVIGASEVGKHLAHRLQSKSIPSQCFVGYFDDRPVARSGAVAGELLGSIRSAPEFVKRDRIDMVYVALPMASQPRIMKLLDGLRDTTATVKFVPDMFIADLIQAKVENAAGLPVIAICDTPFIGSYGLQKRCFDLLACVLALPVIAPLMLLIAVSIRATSTGPVFFKQRRYGLHGEQILVWKFRSMKVMEDGDAVYKQATQDDDRITAIGKILRKTSMDELPQLINVLMGSMSLVGPRPHAVAVNENYRKQISGYMVRHKVKPGITGLAQVNGYRGGDDLHSMSKRIEYDLIYLRSWQLWLDITILFKTMLMLIKGDPKAF